MDVVRLLILELFITNLFCNLGRQWLGPFYYDRHLKSNEHYNWAQGVLDYMYFGLDQAMKIKKTRQINQV
ncbi:stress response protein NST1-like [Prunus yedoensis var. nudiflora]|uniref:Stress response protein NST1-like n=1 Tax=Prunus yedoensis var. nudiflora TaxID=2094558 RepID=A0A314YUS0_PRUYE|nr:stress response protein NST1-like [Prunus yedoensis var. nudiflora]